MNIESLFKSQNKFFASQKTFSLKFRLAQLKKLKTAIKHSEKDFLLALKKDLNKSKEEALICEVFPIYKEIDYFLKNLPQLVKEQKQKTPLALFPSQSKIAVTPKGLQLIISPWNYPLQLNLIPLIGSMAAGNCTIIKPSELATNTSTALKKFFDLHFDSNYINVVEGDQKETQELLEHPFNHVFFTGSTTVGKIVYEQAAKHLSSVTLELGGKTPCIIDKDVSLNVAVKRIAWGKLLNLGQTCIAPDYILCHEKHYNTLLRDLSAEFDKQINNDSSGLCRIINQKHFDRLHNILKQSTSYKEAIIDKASRYISPTILLDVGHQNMPAMKEEIFGPLIPIIKFQHFNEALAIARQYPNPLAAYLFSENDKNIKNFSQKFNFGGACINDTMIQLAHPELPFGGHSSSGLGSYHGSHSFYEFSHKKSICHRSKRLDLEARYFPYNKLKVSILKKAMLGWKN